MLTSLKLKRYSFYSLTYIKLNVNLYVFFNKTKIFFGVRIINNTNEMFLVKHCPILPSKSEWDPGEGNNYRICFTRKFYTEILPK